MKRVKRWRYYCDFCGKAGGSVYHMRNHEKGCTANPNRECGVCRVSGGLQENMTTLLDAIGNDGKESLNKLEELTGNCPACILAAIRQSGICNYDEETGSVPAGYIEYDFKKELKIFWADVSGD